MNETVNAFSSVPVSSALCVYAWVHLRCVRTSDHLLHFTGIESPTKQGAGSSNALESSPHLTLFYSKCISCSQIQLLFLDISRPQNHDQMNVINYPICDNVILAQSGMRNCNYIDIKYPLHANHSCNSHNNSETIIVSISFFAPFYR